MAQVLIVEDSPTQARQLALLLGDAGFDVEIAANAECGYANLIERQFNLVVADINLPGESGFAICRRIKTNPDLNNLPVLIITADSEPGNVLRGLEAGADGFMTKNQTASEIVRRVQRTIGGGAREVQRGGVDYTQVVFRGIEFLLRPTANQLLNVLLSAFEDVLDLNDRLRASEAALRELNVEIRKANEALEQANRVKSKFLKIAAHDLRNPIGAIQGMASLLLEQGADSDPTQRDEFLNRIVTQADSMLHLLEDLLDAGTIRTGRFEVKPILQNPVEVLRQAFEGFTLSAHDKGVQLIWEVPESLPPAELDFNRVLEVLSNLISNGVKYCEPGQSVHLGARAVNGCLEISVRDTGPGIKAEELPRLFKPYAKLSNKPTGGEKSTGLGLSIVREIVDLHGGHVFADSTPGHGTTFNVELPLHRRHATAN
jgi:two-component system, sensor histidine kinase and response regulator